jgi:hypothetical protein
MLFISSSGRRWARKVAQYQCAGGKVCFMMSVLKAYNNYVDLRSLFDGLRKTLD